MSSQISRSYFLSSFFMDAGIHWWVYNRVCGPLLRRQAKRSHWGCGIQLLLVFQVAICTADQYFCHRSFRTNAEHQQFSSRQSAIGTRSGPKKDRRRMRIFAGLLALWGRTGNIRLVGLSASYLSAKKANYWQLEFQFTAWLLISICIVRAIFVPSCLLFNRNEWNDNEVARFAATRLAIFEPIFIIF